MENRLTETGWEEIKEIIINKIEINPFFETVEELKNFDETQLKVTFLEQYYKCDRCDNGFINAPPKDKIYLVSTNYGNKIICKECKNQLTIQSS
jgi:uncharacterized CHY-type Zn-finger protein